MNKVYFISSIVLLWLCCCSVNISYACNLPPDACICNCPKYTSMDTFVYFDGSCSSDLDGYIVDWRWYWPPGSYGHIEGYPPWEAWCKFNDTGIYTVRLEVEDNIGATDIFNCTVYVIKVDLDIVGMSESEEDDPGRYIAVNTDDNNTNSLQDKEEHGTVDNEDDLVEISLSITPSMDHGYIKLEVGQNVLLSAWEEPTKGTSVIDPYHPTEPTMEATWDLSENPFPAPFPEEPHPLWVEAYFVDNPCPYSGFGLSYLHPDTE
ncbi:MAG: PKD domain-containing protein, partial [Planctomycetota bacterium]